MRRRDLSNPLVLAVLLGMLATAACTETNLYSPDVPRKEADRLAVRGRVCTEDPVQALFPVRVILLVDQAAGPLYANYDPAGSRIDILNTFVQTTLNNPQTELAIIGYAGRARKLAPEQGNFTRNPGELFNAVNRLSLAEPCLDDVCRDIHDALRSAGTLIEGDLAELPAGLRVLTQYVVLMIDAGPPDPVSRTSACCLPDDIECIDAGDQPDFGCDRSRATTAVAGFRKTVSDAGAAGLRVHAIHLAAEPNVDGVEVQRNDRVQQILTEMAFAGGGVYERHNAIGGFNAKSLDLLDLRTVLHAKLLMASNLNALPGPTGPRVDSDYDGLSDEEELRLGTLVGTRDSDGDNITDLVEVLTGFDPLSPDTPTACAALRPGDADLDFLTDCDEALVGTEPTLVDTDGDGMPDFIEVIGATDYLNRDAEADTDGDGVANGDELRQHTDPRSTDTRAHLSFGYRYELFDEGIVRELFASGLQRLTGVEINALSKGTTPGLGILAWEPVTGTIRWQDANDQQPGPPVNVRAGGLFDLPSASWAPVQGEDGRKITLEVDPVNLPPAAVNENLRVIFRDRQCIQYTIRNIQLVPTVGRDDGTPPGSNSILLYFAQAPEDRIDAPGPYRLAQIPIIFDPPTTRDPDDAILLIQDEEFIRPSIRFDPIGR